MGGGSFSVDHYARHSHNMGYDTKSAREIFKERSINEAMSPYGLTVRESRDSAEHPNSLAVIVALDTTGSMGTVPHSLVKEGLPHIMGNIIQRGEKDPQICFLGIGDHEVDSAPLQVSQFESSDELLAKWLTAVYLEGGGGGNGGESYLLSWYFAAGHTSIDCFEKRKRKGFLFSIGDEPTLKTISANRLMRLMGPGELQDYTAAQLYEKASEKYNVYHIHTKETLNGGRNPRVIDGWREMLGNNLIVVDHHREIPAIISRVISEMSTVPATVADTVVVSREEEML